MIKKPAMAAIGCVNKMVIDNPSSATNPQQIINGRSPNFNRALSPRNLPIVIAKAKGSAIAIGHDKKLTLEVIKESIPDIERQSIKIVPLKKLMKKNEK